MKVIEEPQLAEDVERKLPFFIDIFLYPLTISGLVNIGIFFFTPFLIGIVDRFILAWVWPIGSVISLLLYALFIGYIFYYLSWCVIDSSKGHLRAPDVKFWQTPDKSDLISQFLLALASLAVCFWPVSVYYIFTERTDLIFWSLLGLGVFFFPMSFLAASLFDAIDALNPALIIRSIFRTFVPYLPLVLFFCAFGLLTFVLIPNLPKARDDWYGVLTYISRFVGHLGSLRFIYRGAVVFYLAMIWVHLLGRFYWFNKYKLNWGL